MNKYYTTSIPLFILGTILLGYSAIRGEGRVVLFFFIPIFYGTSIYSFFGIVCIIIAIFLAFFGFALGCEWRFEPERNTIEIGERPIEKKPIKKRFGGVILLGPIPIVFGSNIKLAIVAILLTIILIILVLILYMYL